VSHLSARESESLSSTYQHHRIPFGLLALFQQQCFQSHFYWHPAAGDYSGLGCAAAIQQSATNKCDQSFQE
jgi:hypothetical protein